MQECIKVVLADANEEFRMLLQETVEKAGDFTVTGSFADGSEALAMIRENGAQVLVMDLVLPGLDGLSLLAELEKLPFAPKTIVVSAFMNEIKSSIFSWWHEFPEPIFKLIPISTFSIVI